MSNYPRHITPTYCVYFVTEAGFYSFYNYTRPHERPLRVINDEEIICYCTSKLKAQTVVDTFNEQGYI
jgi:hypothetical protein